MAASLQLFLPSPFAFLGPTPLSSHQESPDLFSAFLSPLLPCPACCCFPSSCCCLEMSMDFPPFWVGIGGKTVKGKHFCSTTLNTCTVTPCGNVYF